MENEKNQSQPKVSTSGQAYLKNNASSMGCNYSDKEFRQMALRVAKEEFTKARRWPVKVWWDDTAPIFAAIASRIRDELCKGQEPFVVTQYDPYSEPSNGVWLEGPDKAHFFPYGTKLYLHPAPIPADMVLVPREPTEKMCLEGQDLPGCLDVWKAMIAAYEKEQGK